MLAAADGILYRGCVGGNSESSLVKLVHDNGYTTDYYHMEDAIQAPDGTPIKAGTPLGRIGNELPCGGQSNGAHVHFSLLKGNEPVSLDGVMIGGWTLRAGANNYDGWAERGGQRVGRGQLVENFGSTDVTTPPTAPTPPTTENPPTTPAAPTGTVQAPGGNDVNLRSGPRLDASVLRAMKSGETVQITCTARGDVLMGNWGSPTDLWDQLSTGEWISDGFVDTGTTEPVAPAC